MHMYDPPGAKAFVLSLWFKMACKDTKKERCHVLSRVGMFWHVTSQLFFPSLRHLLISMGECHKKTTTTAMSSEDNDHWSPGATW